MSEQAPRIDLRIGNFAISAQGFENPVQPVKQVIRFLQRIIEETPELAGTGFAFDEDQADELLSELSRRTGIPADRLEATPGLVVTAFAAHDLSATPVAPGPIARVEETGSEVLTAPDGESGLFDGDAGIAADKPRAAPPALPEEPVAAPALSAAPQEDASASPSFDEHRMETGEPGAFGDDQASLDGAEAPSEPEPTPPVSLRLAAVDKRDRPDPVETGEIGALAEAAATKPEENIAEPESAPAPGANIFAAEPAHVPEPEPEPEPAPAPAVGASIFASEPEPAPAEGATIFAAEPAPVPEPEPEPAPAVGSNIFAAEPAPEPEPASAPGANIFASQPEPEPKSEPAPAPGANIVAAEPAPEPDPAPAADANIFASQPEPEPKSEPAPAVAGNIFASQPEPEPDPAPAPGANIFAADAPASAPEPNIFGAPSDSVETSSDDPLPLGAPETGEDGPAEPPRPEPAPPSRFDALVARYRRKADAEGDAPRTIPPAPEADEDKQVRTVSAAATGLSPADLAKRADAVTVPEFLTAAAAWIMLVEGRPRFGRRDVMDVFERIPGDHPRSLEARIKGFGKLVRGGALVLVDEGQFALEAGELKRYEALVG